MRKRTLAWYKNVKTISETTGKYPWESYSTVVRAIQSEWIFLQHITSDTGDSFVGVETIIRRNLFAFYFPCKDENPLTHRMISKYDTGP